MSLERFWSKVDKAGPVPPNAPHLGECWVWTSTTDPKGYGRLLLARRVRRAHRVAFEMARGPVPDGLELDHLCRNRACVNPAHLEAVTHVENVKRGRVAESNRVRGASVEACSLGHPYSTENTGRNVTNGRRYCKACELKRRHERVARISAERKALRALA